MLKISVLISISFIFIISCSVKSVDIAKIKESLIVYNEPPIPENEWVLVEALKPKDTLNILRVTYEICGGIQDSLFCRAVFVHKNLKIYRCVAPWLGNKELVMRYMQTMSIKKENIKHK